LTHYEWAYLKAHVNCNDEKSTAGGDSCKFAKDQDLWLVGSLKRNASGSE